MQDDAFWTSDAANDIEFGDEMHPRRKSVGAQKGRSRHNSSSEREKEDLWEDVEEEERERDNEKHKKKNISYWLPWSSWGGSVTGKKSRGKKKEETTSTAAKTS